MALFRVFAYQVEPGRTAGGGAPHPSGGPARLTSEIEQALEQVDSRWNQERRILVDLKLDTSTRTSDMRERLLKLAFGTDAEAHIAASEVAQSLSAAMDFRSSPCLCIIAISHTSGGNRSVTIWTFPRDQAFQLQAGSQGVTVANLTDVFSQTSTLRKAARFEGGTGRTDFIAGRVLDFQANQARQEVANFWIGRFLDAALAIGSESGTRMLAAALKNTWERTSDSDELEQLFAATTAIRSSPQTRWSLAQFADQYLGPALRERFLGAAPNGAAVTSSFDFDRETFERHAQFRVFHLATGVVVSSPVAEIGQSVLISGIQEKTLSCEGVIVDERLRARA